MPKKMDIVKELLSFSSDELFENLSEEDKKILLSDCALMHSNKSFSKICNEVYTREVLNTIQTSETTEQMAEGRGKLLGVAGVIALIQDYNSQYLESIKKEEDFDKNDII